MTLNGSLLMVSCKSVDGNVPEGNTSDHVTVMPVARVLTKQEGYVLLNFKIGASGWYSCPVFSSTYTSFVAYLGRIGGSSNKSGSG
jgi:hypothetical protein